MTERSQFWATTNTGDGPSSGYTADNMFEVFRAFFTGSTGADLSGVAADYLNKLAVSGSSSPLTVATGAALCYGIPYFNSANVSVTVPTPTTATRIDRIVLRASWSAQTVRVTRVAGVEGSGAPSLTQSAGVTWDMALAQVQITTGGVITITDEREYLQGLGDGGVGTAKLADGAVTTAKLANNSVTSAKIVDGTIATGDLADSAVTGTKIADGTITGPKLAAGTIAWTQLGDNIVYANNLADDNVTNAKLGNMAQATVKGRAASGGTGDPTDLTAAQVINIIATADGASSGLDADLLDGQHGSAYATSGHTHGTGTIADGAVTTPKIADGNVTNAKLANEAQATIKGRASGAGTGAPTDLSAAQVVAIITAADGAGSGLDADLLDGQQATAFAAASHSHGASDITDNAVTNAKLADMGQGTIKGRAYGAGTGDPTDLSAAQVAAIIDQVSAQAIVSFGSDFSPGGTPRVKNIGGALLLQGYVDYTGSTTTLTILACTLPSGYWPASACRCVFVDEANGLVKVGYVSSSGGVYVKAPANGARYYLDSITIPS